MACRVQGNSFSISCSGEYAASWTHRFQFGIGEVARQLGTSILAHGGFETKGVVSCFGLGHFARSSCGAWLWYL